MGILARSFAIFSATLVAGCASFFGVVTPPPTHSAQPIDLQIVEARGDSIVLKITTISTTDRSTMLEVYRLDDDQEEATVIQEIILDTNLRNALRDGIEYVDRGLEPERSYRYFVLVLADVENELSNRVDVRWKEAPPLPKNLSATTKIGAVFLSWDASPYGAVVFRRNVLVDGSVPERIAEIPSGVSFFADTDAQPNDVFTYQIALANSADRFRHYGPASEPIYVTVGARSAE